MAFYFFYICFAHIIKVWIISAVFPQLNLRVFFLTLNAPEYKAVNNARSRLSFVFTRSVTHVSLQPLSSLWPTAVIVYSRSPAFLLGSVGHPTLITVGHLTERIIRNGNTEETHHSHHPTIALAFLTTNGLFTQMSLLSQPTDIRRRRRLKAVSERAWNEFPLEIFSCKRDVILVDGSPQ